MICEQKLHINPDAGKIEAPGSTEGEILIDSHPLHGTFVGEGQYISHEEHFGTPYWVVGADEECFSEVAECGTSANTEWNEILGLARWNEEAIEARCEGRYEAAEQLLRQALDVTGSKIDHNNPMVLTCSNNLATVLQDQAKLDQAEYLFSRVLDIRENVLGLEDHSTLLSLNNLATVLRDMGRQDEAEQLLRIAIAIGDDTLGRGHKDMCTFANNLAVC